MKLEVIKADITTIRVDAVVNAANTSLLGGGGVDGAIHRKGGKQILEECLIIRNRQGGCEVGAAVITTAGNLPARKVIHTVGPRWNGGNSGEDEKLKSCYENSLKLAEENQLTTIAFPNISTGIYRFPKKRAAKIALETVKNWKGEFIKEIKFVCFDEENYLIYQELMEESRSPKIELLAGGGNLTELKSLLESHHTQLEIDVALENAIAYSQIETAEYLLSLGGDLSNFDYQGTYFAVHNNEIEGLKFAIQKGVDVNVNNGQLLNTAVVTVYNTKDPTTLKYLLEIGADVKLLSKDILDTFGTDEIKEIINNVAHIR